MKKRYGLLKYLRDDEVKVIINKYLESIVDLRIVEIEPIIDNKCLFYKVGYVLNYKGEEKLVYNEISKGRFLQLLNDALSFNNYLVSKIDLKIEQERVIYKVYYKLIIECGLTRLRGK